MSNATNRWLDRLAAADKAKGGTGSDYRLSQLLEIERQRVSRYRRELDQAMGDDVALALAEALEKLDDRVHPLVIIGDIRTERGRTEREKRLWMLVARNAKKLASVGGVGVGAAAILAAQFGPALSESALRLCILCSIAAGSVLAANDPRQAPKPRPPRYIPGRIAPLSVLTARRAA